MQTIYQKLQQEKLAKEQAKEAQRKTLEKQLKMWTKRREDLRKVGSSAIDQTFLRRSIDKCSDEIDKILKML